MSRRPMVMYISIIVMTLAAFVLGVVACWVVKGLQQPHCPTEDSCTVDYRDGEWHVEEVTP